MDEPFEVISMGIWCPGTTKTNATTTKTQKAMLTSFDNLTVFANLTFSLQVTLEMIARLAFLHFFAPNELLKLAIVDGGSKMKGALIAMCELLGVPCYQAPPEAHDLILPQMCEQNTKDWSSRRRVMQKMGDQCALCSMHMERITG
jgi:hypothetical protein